ncbi:GTPase [Streptomyces albus]|uniref:GTPase n=1 Tax=Streptomyces albus TaxID=1888 RepID=UPI00099B3262|nr:GTPase [Streptomyces albus]
MAFTADRPEDAEHPLSGTDTAGPRPAEHAPPLLPTARAEAAHRPGPAAGAEPGAEPVPAVPPRSGRDPDPRTEPCASAPGASREPGCRTEPDAGARTGAGAHAEQGPAGGGTDRANVGPDTGADAGPDIALDAGSDIRPDTGSDAAGVLAARTETAREDGVRPAEAPVAPEDGEAGAALTAPARTPPAPRHGGHPREAGPGPVPDRAPEPGPAEDLAWNDGLIARRAPWTGVARSTRPYDIERARPGLRAEDTTTADGGDGNGGDGAHAAEAGDEAGTGTPTGKGGGSGSASAAPGLPAVPAPPRPPAGFSRALRTRLEALRELVGLSATRLDARTLAEAGQVLDEAVARHRLSLDHTVVALAGAGGSGKSTLFNALVGAPVSEVGIRRPTTAAPLACTWSDGADGLLDRLGVPAALRRRAPGAPFRQGDAGGHGPDLDGLVLLDLPDHDSAVPGHRRQVDRLLGLVDAVVWVVDPEKYADAVLHERYLRPLAGYDEVTFVVLNQVDRLPGDAAHRVLHDLRRLLDEDGLAVGEHGEPGAAVLALSALTGEGVGELRERLARFAASRTAAERRLAADVDGAAGRLAPVCLAGGWTGLSARSREEFEDRLAAAVGAVAAGQAAERAWLSRAEEACGTPWTKLRHRLAARRSPAPAAAEPVTGPASGSVPGEDTARPRPDGPAATPVAAPERGTPRDTGTDPGVSTGTGGTGTGGAGTDAADGRPEPRAARAVVEQAVRTVAGDATAGLPEPWARAVLDSAVSGTEELVEALDRATVRPVPGGRPVRPRWWAVVSVVQWLLPALHGAVAVWLVTLLTAGPAGDWRWPALLLATASVCGPLLARVCRLAARGPARRHGQETERWLRDVSAACGRSRVLEPVAAELLRYREARAQHAVTSGAPGRL